MIHPPQNRAWPRMGGCTAAALLVGFAAAADPALYDFAESSLVKLGDDNFASDMTKDTKHVWVVEYYADWCGHCKSFAKGYEKAATNLKGIVKFGAVNADEAKSTMQTAGVQERPAPLLLPAPPPCTTLRAPTPRPAVPELPDHQALRGRGDPQPVHRQDDEDGCRLQRPAHGTCDGRVCNLAGVLPSPLAAQRSSTAPMPSPRPLAGLPPRSPRLPHRTHRARCRRRLAAAVVRHTGHGQDCDRLQGQRHASEGAALHEQE